MAPYDMDFADTLLSVILDIIEKNDRNIRQHEYKYDFVEIGRDEFEHEGEIKTRTIEDIVKPQLDPNQFEIGWYHISLKESPNDTYPKSHYMQIMFTLRHK